MNEREDLAYYIWDGYKDAHGIRPRFMGLWDADGVAADWTLERLQAEAASISRDVEASIIEDRAHEQRAIIAFEAAIQVAIASGAGDRETAIRWLRDAEDDPHAAGDDGYFEFLQGLPYGFLKGEDPYGTGWNVVKLGDLI
jgi:hypothetical protein